MRKPDSLRAALVAAMPDFGTNPERLRIFVDKGRLVSRLTPALAYEWRYTIRIEILDLTGSADAIAVPLLLWLREHQPDRLLDFAREDDALGFAADLIDEQTWDMAWTFELSEAVRVTPAECGYEVVHLPAPPIPDADLLGGPLAHVDLGSEPLL